MTTVAQLGVDLQLNHAEFDAALLREEEKLKNFGAGIAAKAKIDIELVSNTTAGSLAKYATAIKEIQSKKAEIVLEFVSNVTLSELRGYASVIERLPTTKSIEVITTYTQNGTPPPIPNQPPGGGRTGRSLMHQGFQNLAAGAILTTAIDAPLIGAGAASLKFAGDFQQAMTLVGNMTDVGKQNIASLSQQILALSKDPHVRSTPVELAEGLYDVASKGLDATNSLKALTAAAVGSAAGEGPVKVIGKTLTDVSAAYGRMDFARIMDTITVAVKKGGGEANEYAAAFSKVIPIAAQVGVSFEEVAAQMASATRIGLKPSEAATALRQIFNNLIDPSQKSAKAMKELGTSVEEVRNMLRDQGLFNTLKDLSERTGGRIGPITELFGNIRALTGFLSTTGKNTLDEYRQTLVSTYAAAGDTAQAAAEASKTFNFQLDKLKSSAQAAAIEIGNRLIPVATNFAQVVAKDIPVALRAWDNLPGVVKALGVALLSVAAVSGPLLALAGTIQIIAGVMETVGPMIAAAGGLTALSNPIALGIAAAASAALLLWLHFQKANDEEEKLRQNAQNLDRAMSGAMSEATSSKAKTAIGELQEKIVNAGEDADKLSAALDSAMATKREIKELGLAPGAEAALTSRIDQIISEILSKFKHLGETYVSPDSDQPAGIIEAANKRWNDAAAQANKLGIKMPSRPDADDMFDHGVGSMGTITKASAKKYGEEVDQALDEVLLRIRDKQSSINIAFRQTIAGRMEQVLQTDPNNQARILKIMKEWDDAVKAGTAKLPPGSRELEIHGQAEDRIKANTKTIQDRADKAKQAAKDAAADAAQKQAEIDQETARRSAQVAEKTLGEKSRMWDQFRGRTESIIGQIRQMEEQGGLQGEKTAKAREEAELLKTIYDGIPDSIKRQQIELAGVEERLKRILGLRDGFRQMFDGMFGQLGGPGRQALSQFAAELEKRLGQADAWRGLQGQRTALALPLVGTAEANIADLKSRQEQIQNSLSKSSAVYDGTGSSALGTRIADQAMSLQLNGTARKFADRCDALADKAIQAATSQFNGIVGKRAGDTAAKTMERFKAAGIGQAYAPGMALQAGDILYSGTRVGHGSGHAMIVGPDGRILDQYGAHAKPTTVPDWVVRPGGTASGPAADFSPLVRSPQISVYDPRQVRLPADIPFDPRLLRMRDLPAAWGGMMQDHIALPGEVTSARTAFQAQLMPLWSQLAPALDRLAVRSRAGRSGTPLSPDFLSQIDEDRHTRAALGPIFSPDSLSEWRKNSNTVDYDESVRQVTNSARNSIRQMGSEIRAAANDNNPYTALLDSFKTGENRFLTSGWQDRLKEMTLGKMVSEARAATRRLALEAGGQFQARQSVADMLVGDGTFNSAAYERASFIASKRAEIYNSEDIRHLRDAGKETEAAAQAQARLNLAIQEFDSQKATDTLKGYAESMRGMSDELGLGSFKIGLLQNGMSPANAEIEGQVESEKRSSRKALDSSVIQIDRSLNPADMMKSIEDQVAAGKIFAEQADEKAGAQSDVRRRLLLQGRQSSWLTDQAGYDFQHPLDLALLNQRAASASLIPNSEAARAAALDQKIQEQRNQFASAVYGGQMDPDEAKRRGDEFERQARIEDQIQRATESVNAVLSTRNGILDQEQQRQEALARTAVDRVAIEQKFAADRLALTGRAETAEESKYRLMLEGEQRVTAAAQDRLDLLRSAGGELTDIYKSVMNRDLKGIAQRVRENVQDLVARQMTSATLGRNSVDDRATGLLGLLGIGRHTRNGVLPGVTGVAGPLSAMTETAAGPVNSAGILGLGPVVQKLPETIQHAINTAIMQINTATIYVQNASIIGGSGGAGESGMFDFLGSLGRNGAAGTVASAGQWAAGQGDVFTLGGS